ncbi:MAG: polyketide cyclase [Jatrophihabitans sp.]|nr:MAG: polyketide cyclase [Jatrophihabitans sp.]
MNATGTNQTSIEAHPTLPLITITREFDAPPDRVYRAWTDPELFVRWIGPRSIDTRVDHWDARTGGSWHYTSSRDGEQWGFFGSFHELRPNERLVQTFTFEGYPDGVSLETLVLTDLGDGRTRATTTGVVASLEDRDAILRSGMEVGVIEGYEKLDELLADGR